jgi:hypothetical protein
VPRERIRVDLNITHSSEVTAERILSGSLGWYTCYSVGINRYVYVSIICISAFCT